MIRLENVSKIYRNKERETTAISDCSLEFPSTGLFFLTGKSGCGKTTLLNLISGIDNYDSGKIYVDEKELKQMSIAQLERYRNLDIGIVFQSYNLMHDISVYHNIELALKIQKWENKSKEDVQLMIKKTLSFVELQDYENRKISELSGGEKQRVAIARALVKGAKIILADEPTGNLDSKNSDSILSLFKKISKTCLVIIVTHDKASAKKFGDQIITIKDGKILHIEKNIENETVYNVKIKNDSLDQSIEYCSYDHENMLDNAKTYIEQNKVNSNHFFISIKISKNNYSNEISTFNDEPYDVFDRKKLSHQKLDFLSTLKFTNVFMKKKKHRLCISILLVTITMFLLLISSFIKNYDESVIISQYLNDYQPPYIIGSMQSSYVNKFNEEKNFDITSGEKLCNKFGSIDSVSNFFGFKNNEVLSEDIQKDNYKSFSGATVFYVDNKKQTINLNLKNGQMPKNSSEIVLTDYLAKELSVDIGDIVYYHQIPLILSGIIQTDYIEASLDRKILLGQIDEYLDYKMQYYYFLAIVDDSYKEEYLKDSSYVFLPLSNFMLQNMESQYLDEHNSTLLYGCSEDIFIDELIAGRLPLEDNEVLVSYEFAKEYNLLNDGVLSTKSYSFLDVSASQYNNCYSNYFNVYEVFQNGVKIVGVVSPHYSHVNISDIYIRHNVFQMILDKYYECYYYNGLMFNCAEISEYDNLVKSAQNERISFDEPSIMKIMDFKVVLNDLESIINIIVFIISFLTFITIINYISSSINENSKNIGILQALGISRFDVAIVFLLESILLYIFSTIISIFSTFTFLNYINLWYNKSNSSVTYDILTWDVNTSLGAFGSILLVCIVASLYPIYKLTRKRPVEIIRQHDQ